MTSYKVDANAHGRAALFVPNTVFPAYVYDPQKGFEDGAGTNPAMWLQGPPQLEEFNWEEEPPFPRLAHKLERIARTSSLTSAVSATIDAALSINLRQRSFVRAATHYAFLTLAEVDAIDWSLVPFPEKVTWQAVLLEEPVSAVFRKVRSVLEAKGVRID